MTEIFGPLVKTLRFEAKYSYFKSCLAGTKKQKKTFSKLWQNGIRCTFLAYSQKSI